jgi:hypothetical protein
VTFGSDLGRLGTRGEIRVWNVFHYYLGAKYFKELGYDDLYPAALAADREGANTWRVVKRVRDLESYQVELRSDRADHYRPEEAFSKERWQSFKQDVAALSSYREPKEWRNVFRDRGYNGTPVWTAMGRLIGSVVPITHRLSPVVLASLDLILLGTTFLLMARCLGWYRTAILSLLFVASPVNSGRLIGGFLQYDWLCAGIASVCCYRIRREKIAGVLIAWAVMTRVFPILFVVATGLPALAAVLRQRRIPYRAHRRALRYLLSFVVTSCLLFGLSLANGRGLSGWLEFGRAITTHSDSHVTGDRRIGLEHLMAHGLGWGSSEWDLDADSERRSDHLEQQRFLFRASATLLLGLFLVVAWRSRSWQSQTLAMVPAFALLVMSRYYSSFLILIPLTAARRSATERFLAAGQLATCAAYYLARVADFGRFASYGVLNLALFVCLVFSLSLLALPTVRLARARDGSGRLGVGRQSVIPRHP